MSWTSRHRDNMLAGQSNFTLAAILLLAFALRLGFAVIANVDVRGVFRFDPSMYDHFAQQIAMGKGMIGLDGEPIAHFPPAYTLLLAGLYSLFDASVESAWVWNALMGALTCWLLWALARRIFDAGTGIFAATIFALASGDIFYSALPLSDPTFTCLLLLLLCLFVSWQSTAMGKSNCRRWGKILDVRQAIILSNLACSLYMLARAASPGCYHCPGSERDNSSSGLSSSR